jgi:hypothetical protein
MTFKKVGMVVFLIFSLFSTYALFAQAANPGFVSGNIWYSKDPFEEGDKIKVYTFVFNPDSRELSGTVIFFDKTTLLGKKNFTVAGKRAEDVSIDWTVNAGDHTIFAKIENAKLLLADGTYEEIYIAENETEKSTTTVAKKIISKVVEKDTDNSINNTLGDLGNLIQDKTPEFIVKPMVLGASTFEELRQEIVNSTEDKKEEVKKEIKALENTKVKLESKTAKSTLLKPFKYVELFLLTISVFILNNRILFYGLIAIFIFIIIRLIWNKFFSRF